MRIIITTLSTLAIVTSVNTATAEQAKVSGECCKRPSIASPNLLVQDKQIVINKEEATVKAEKSVIKHKEEKSIKVIKHEDKNVAKEKQLRKKNFSVTTSKNTSTTGVASQTDNSKLREGFYIEAKGGVAMPRKLTHEMIDFNKPKRAAIFEVRGGYNFNRFAVDVGVIQSLRNRLTRQDSELMPAISPPFVNANFKHNANLKFTAIVLSAYCNMMHYKRFTPYVGAGAGVSRNTLSKMEVYTDYPNPGGPYSMSKIRDAGTVNNFMWQAMIGTKYLVNNNLELSLEYKYMDLGKFRTGRHSLMSDGSIEEDPIERSRLRTDTFLMGIRYYF